MRDNWTTMYEVLRQYRNAAFRHIAVTLEREAGSEWFAAAVEPLFGQEEWASLERNVGEQYLRLTIPTPARSEWLGVAHLGTIVEKHGRLLVPEVRGLLPKQRQRVIDDVVSNARLLRAVRDPVSHPPSSDSSELPLRDLLYFTTLAQRVLASFGLPDDVAQLDLFLSESGTPPGAEPVTSLPPPSSMVTNFVGREPELRRLREWLADSEEPIHVVAGGGGTGKSALAFQAAATAAAIRPEFIIWMSAKSRQLVAGTVVPLEADIYTEVDVVERLWRFFGGDGPAKEAVVMDMLSGTPGVIIADDVDSLVGDGGDRARAMLTRTIPYRTRTRVLVTSRRELFGLENVTTTLAGLLEAETGEFLKSRCDEQGIDIAFTNDQIRELHRASSGTPLYLIDLLRFVRTFDIETALRMWKSDDGDASREYALQRELEMLSEMSRKVLVAASSAPGIVSALDLCAILGVQEQAVMLAVNELRSLFFLPRPSYIEGVARFSVPAPTGQLVEKMTRGQFEFDQVRGATAHYFESATESGYERGRIGEVVRGVQFLIKKGEYQEAEQQITNALKTTPGHPDLVGLYGYLYKRWIPQRFTDADTNFKKAASLNCRNPMVYREWADLHMQKKEYQTAAEAAEVGLSACGPHPQLLRIATATRRDLGHRLRNNMQTPRSIQEYRLAYGHMIKIPDANNDVDRWQVSDEDYARLRSSVVDVLAVLDPDSVRPTSGG